MKYIIIIMLCMLSAPAWTQLNEDVVIFPKYKMFEYAPQLMYIDTLGDKMVLIANYAWSDSPGLPAFYDTVVAMLFDWEGTIYREVNLPLEIHSCPNVIQTPQGFLLVWFTHLNEITGPDYGSYFFIYQLNKKFQVLNHQIINLSSSEKLVDNPYAGIMGSFFTQADTIYSVFPIEYRDTVANNRGFAILKFDLAGNYLNYSFLPDKQAVFARNGMKEIFPLPGIPDTLLMPQSSYYNKVASDFSSIEVLKTKPYIYWLADYALQRDDKYIYGFGANLQQFPPKKSMSLFKMNTDLKILDTVKLTFTYDVPNGHHVDELINGFPYGCFYQDEEGNFNGVSYYNGVSGGHLPYQSRIFVTKFTPDMEVLCQRMYEVPGWKVNLYSGIYLGDGELAVSGSMDTMGPPWGIRNYHPFVGRIRNGCDISWAQEVSTLSVQPFKILEGEVSISPNPANNVIQLSYSHPEANIERVVFYDVSGRVKHTQAWRQDLEINVANWSPGMYLMRLTTTEGHFAVGKFTKQ